MNTCKCDQCLGKKAHYSSYYHREEGFDLETHFTIKGLHDRIAKSERGLDKCDCAYCGNKQGDEKMIVTSNVELPPPEETPVAIHMTLAEMWEIEDQLSHISNYKFSGALNTFYMTLPEKGERP